VISYAQNAEDVVLARALPATEGFYVDVGAGHPETASVTKYFYELGWHGINIEPRSDAIALLEQQRPRDINLRVAAGASEGTAELYVVEGDPDLSTIDNTDLGYLRDRGYGSAAETVRVRTLNTILEEHDVTAIDFLKVDVEGSEADVLKGIDLNRWTPTVIVIESILPWSRVRNDANWRTILESQGYREACFDGINLFFTAEQDVAIAAALAPASALDDYETADAAATRIELDRLRGFIGKLEAEVTRYGEWEEEVTEYVRTLESQLARPADLRGPEKAAYPPASPRLAIVGTPESGDEWISAVLADVLDAKELPVRHPADVDWAGLPDRFVIQLHWQRSRHLERMLTDHGVLVISPARHPLDVLLSILDRAQHKDSAGAWLGGAAGSEEQLRGSGPRDPAFLAWATSPRARLLLSLTPDWWTTPKTHRLRCEQLMADPNAELVAFLARSELEPVADLNAALKQHSTSTADPPPDDALTARTSSYTWQETLSAQYVDVLVATHREVFVSLGYDPDERALPR
jgi:FkbM family methyltransferase